MSRTTEAPEQSGDPAEPGLKRVMGRKLLLLFIVGDILGTGVYALTGQVAGEVGGAAWAPFLIAFVVATITAFSYLELVTKYPQAAGAALYTHKAFGIHLVTFVVAFMVMSSGITSASTASNAFAGFLNDGFGLGMADGSTPLLLIALGFMTLVALVNFRGVGESVKANVVLTLVELSGLLLVIFVGLWGVTQGRADFSRVVVFESGDDKSVFLAVTAATTLAFFAMVGFEDSVNMAEECKDPVKDFPRVMLTGLSVTGLIYVAVAITAVALVPVGDLTDPTKASALTQVVAAGAPNLPFDVIFPFIGMFAVANSALINMLMASRLLYGLANQGVLPRAFGRVHRTRQTPWVSIVVTTLISYGLITYVVRQSGTEAGSDAIALLGGTTSLLLLVVFTVVNVALLVLRRRPVEHQHFRTWTPLAVVGALTCAFLAGPWARSAEQQEQYLIAGALVAVGLVLSFFTWLYRRTAKHEKIHFEHVEDLDTDKPQAGYPKR
ncbi:amino acid/polyamine/organocation transporter (APC superfamily) [Isoptericola jiangsuensis]|uniref:Amino acid/polyamine/organocation transporter (APC superfamily) n=1 Tax=Isoptericola jiangsuensis TaxID=548579 RepID=A0A2A9F264_9MICO|nr:APC family permease [Isoptericola jiangsuensis]PFG44861.1 amino acid/polyamine/organocation transporter (APC superfamily) [Isoptericola jiangsuensis]